MSEITQYYKVTVSSPSEAKNKVNFDLTPYIDSNLTITDEDGLVKECSFTISRSLLMIDVLAIGMVVEIVGGDLLESQNLFVGYIKSLEPDFTESGDVELTIKCHSTEGKSLNVSVKDLIYPSKTNSESWAKQALTFTDIITNLARKMGIIVRSENIQVSKEITATFETPVKQSNCTDWKFIQQLSEKLGCTVWTEERGGNSYLYLKDDSSIVTTIGDITFFYLSRNPDGSFMDITASANQIQVRSLSVKLDTDNSVGSFKRRQTTDKDGNPITQVYTDRPAKGENGGEEDSTKTERWVLDEDKVKALPSEERRRLIELFLSGKVTWDGDEYGVAARNYFRKETSDESSRSDVPNNIQVQNISKENKVDPNGVTSSQAVKEGTGSTSKYIQIESAKIAKLSSEERSRVMGRIIRGEMTEKDKSLYTVIDSTPKANKEENTAPSTGLGQNTQVNKKASVKPISLGTDKRKRDDGFTITASIFGDLRIKGRKSYLIEGISKYSGIYYLYKITYTFGSNGFNMDLVFTK